MSLSLKNKRILTVLCAVIFAFAFISAFALPKYALAEAVTEETITKFYEDNVESVKLIDGNANKFDASYNQRAFLGLEKAYDMLEKEVEIVNKLNALPKKYKAQDYSAETYGKIDAKINSLIGTVRSQFESYGLEKQAEINQRIDNTDKQLAEYKTLEQTFDDKKLAVGDEIKQKYDAVKQPNTANPEAKPNEVVGVLDQTALAELDKAYADINAELDKITYNAASEKEANDLLNKLDELAIEADKRFRVIPKNDLERAYDAVSDYRDVVEGTETVKLTPEQAKKLADDAVNKAKTDFIDGASPSVVKKYSAEISQINTYLKGGFTEPDVDLSLKDTIQTEDGAVKISAYKVGDTRELYKVFPYDAKISVYKSANGAGKQNAYKAIHKKHSDLSVSYFIYLDVYKGSKTWKPVTKSDDEKDVVYVVSLDLNKYYDNYVKNYDGFLEGLLKNVSFLQKKAVGSNKLGAITETYNKLSEGNNTNSNNLINAGGKSLVYSYFRQDGKGAVSALDYGLDTTGGILMFETSNFGTFAVSQNSNGNLFTNPIFWIILAVAIIAIIVILIIILKNIKYTFKFITNGGTDVKPVKARLNESFPLPDPPTREGYVFGGWYLDEQLTTRFIDTKVKKRKGRKIYAKWYESDIPAKFVKYFEKLRNEMLCYSKVGPIGNMGLEEKETLAKLFADKDGVYLYTALNAKRLNNKGFDVEDASDEFAATPAKKTVDGKESFKEAINLIGVLMAKKGLQNVGPATLDEEPMTLEERKNGFEFVVENDRVAVSLSDYYEYLRYYIKSFVLYRQSPNVDDGDVLVRLYLDEENINLYLALTPSGELVSAASKFQDTPALFKCKDVIEDINKACDYVDRVMSANGFEKRNEAINDYKLQKAKTGCGFGFRVTLD